MKTIRSPKHWLVALATLFSLTQTASAVTYQSLNFEGDTAGDKPSGFTTYSPSTNTTTNGNKVVDATTTDVNPLTGKSLYIYDLTGASSTKLYGNINGTENLTNVRVDFDFQRMYSVLSTDVDTRIHFAIGRVGDALNAKATRPFDVRFLNNGNLIVSDNDANTYLTTHAYNTTGSNEFTLFANSHDTNSVDYSYSDSVDGSGTLLPNTFVIYLNGVRKGPYTFVTTPTTSVDFYSGNADLGQIGFFQDTSRQGGIVFDNIVITSVFDATAPIVNAITSDTSVVSGDEMILSVTAVGTGTLSYQWYSGVSGDTTNLIPDAIESTYPVSNITGTLQYWVRVTNDSGYADSDTVDITLHTPVTTVVSDLASFNAAVAVARAGDQILLADGTTWTDVALNVSGTGTAMNPIYVGAETPGEVSVMGASTLNIGGSYITVSGLMFTGRYTGTSGKLLNFRYGGINATHCRITQCSVIGYYPESGVQTEWVNLYGMYNRVDHCYFSEHNVPGVTVVVWLDNVNPTYHLIDHNHFANRDYAGGTNGYETIRIGTSTESLSVSGTVVEYNLFEKTNGEVETISNKSCQNVYRYNTFLRCRGTLTLRQGNECLVEGNYFLGKNEHTYETGGIRIIGRDHTVINNYFGGTTGLREGAITVESGILGGPLDGYASANNALIAFNTFVGNEGPLVDVGTGYGSTASTYTGPFTRNELPTGVVIANNVFRTIGYYSEIFSGYALGTHTWTGNYAFGQTSLGTNVPSAGFTIQDPLLAIDSATGVYRPASNSPLINTSVGDWTEVAIDIDGETRDATPDVGADEYSALSTATPMTSSTAGPTWLNSDRVEFVQVPADTFASLNRYGMGQYNSPWMGDFFGGYYPWLHLKYFGWVYLYGNNDSFFLYDTVMGWLWTHSTYFSWMYSYEIGDWVWYRPDTKSPRKLWNNATQAWFDSTSLE
jgi:poly(beta-D-mannuronate) lyase